MKAGGHEPRLRVIINGEGRESALFQPDMQVSGVWDIDPGQLREKGISGILIDIDNTIASWGDYHIPEAVWEWLKEVRRQGLGICLLSNNYTSRARRFSAMLGAPVVYGWVKPWPWGYRRAMKLLGIGHEQAVMIGDQLFTDILGAKRLGIYSILVKPMSHRELPHTRFKRVLERMVLGRGERR